MTSMTHTKYLPRPLKSILYATVVVGEAEILDNPPATSRVETYLRKYGKSIKDLDMTVAEFRKAYTVPILVTPQAMRGFVD